MFAFANANPFCRTGRPASEITVPKANPRWFYLTPNLASERNDAPMNRACRYVKPFGVVGGIIGISIPLTYGSYAIYSVWSQPPLPPGQASCGMPVIGGLVAILIGCPIVGCIFAAIGALVGALFDLVFGVTKNGTNTQVTDEGVKKLQQALPNCTTERNGPTLPAR